MLSQIYQRVLLGSGPEAHQAQVVGVGIDRGEDGEDSAQCDRCLNRAAAHPQRLETSHFFWKSRL